MNVTALKKEKDDPRTELRRAIADAQRAKAAVVRQNDGIERAQQLVQAARRKADAASKAVAAAQDEDAQQLAAAIINGDTASPQATRRAKEAESEAGGAVMMTRAAYERLESDLKDAERAAERAVKDVNIHVAAVLMPIAKRLTDEAKHYRAEYLKRQHVLDALCMSLDGFTRLDFSVREEEHRQLCGSVRQRWLDVISALSRDSSAEIPALDGMTTTPPRVA